MSDNKIYLARNKDKTLRLFNEKPRRGDEGDIFRKGCWETKSRRSMKEMFIDDELFPELTWEDDPIEISLDKIGICRCANCKKVFAYYDNDIVDKSEPEKELFWIYVKCPNCGIQNNI